MKFFKHTNTKKIVVGSILAHIWLFTYTGCTIEPPLHLPAQDIVSEMPIVELELEVMWELDVNWRAKWYYGWDMEDSLRWGPLAYPEPKEYEIRRYYLGDAPGLPHTTVSPKYITVPRYRDHFEFGYHDILVWTGFGYLPFGQAVIIDESSLDNVYATTSSRSTNFANRRKTTEENGFKHHNNPEIFYRCYERDFYISRDTADYDFFDPVERLWVKRSEADLVPAVYIYLVQVILHNNRGRISGISDACAINGLAEYTNVTTGHTSMEDASVLFDMRLKKDCDKLGEKVDVVGGMLTTFGLCDLGPYTPTRGRSYNGLRMDLDNDFSLNLHFANSMDSTYVFTVTDQFRQQCNGGVITVELDVDTLDIPVNPKPAGGGSAFDPYVEDYDNEEHEISM